MFQTHPSINECVYILQNFEISLNFIIVRRRFLLKVCETKCFGNTSTLSNENHPWMLSLHLYCFIHKHIMHSAIFIPARNCFIQHPQFLCMWCHVAGDSAVNYFISFVISLFSFISSPFFTLIDLLLFNDLILLFELFWLLYLFLLIYVCISSSANNIVIFCTTTNSFLPMTISAWNFSFFTLLSDQKVPTELKKAIMQARQDKKLTQSQLAQVYHFSVSLLPNHPPKT